MELKKAETLAEVKATFEGIEENGDEWFSNLLARDDELTRWVEKGQVSVAATPTTALLLRQRYGCQRLYFANVKSETLTEDLKSFLVDAPEKIITMVLNRSRENEPVKNLLRAANFSHYALLKRVVKVNEPKTPEKIVVEYARIDDLPRIEEILRRYFDPLLDHWPDKDEIEEAIKAKRILVARLENDVIAAFHSFEKKGMSVYSRYVVSVEEFRSRMPYAPILLRQNLRLHRDCRKYLGWILDDNEVSIKVHQALGFKFDGATEEAFVLGAIEPNHVRKA